MTVDIRASVGNQTIETAYFEQPAGPCGVFGGVCCLLYTLVMGKCCGKV